MLIPLPIKEFILSNPPKESRMKEINDLLIILGKKLKKLKFDTEIIEEINELKKEYPNTDTIKIQGYLVLLKLLDSPNLCNTLRLKYQPVLKVEEEISKKLNFIHHKNSPFKVVLIEPRNLLKKYL